jgi:hypothetical protein
MLSRARSTFPRYGAGSFWERTMKKLRAAMNVAALLCTAIAILVQCLCVGAAAGDQCNEHVE